MQPIQITIQKIHQRTPIIDTRQLYTLIPPIFSLLFCFSIKLGRIISKNGVEFHYLTIDIYLVLIQSFINMRAVSHPLVSAQFRIPTFLTYFIIYILNITQNTTRMSQPIPNNKELQVVYQLKY